MKTRIPTEHEEQVCLVNWWRQKFPTLLLFSIPNGGKRAMSVAKRLKAEGQTPGIPDLHCPKYSLWIELKRTKGGKVSPEQEKIIKYLKLIGHTVIIGKGATDASKQILTFLKDKQ